MNVARLVCPAIRWRDATGFAHEQPSIDAALALGVGGFIIFGGTADAVAQLTAELERRAGRPLLFGSDLERGAGQQFAGLTQLPPPGALGALGDLAAIRRAGEITAAEALSVGVQWVFAPDADLDVLAGNPIVQSRAFGADPAEVSAAVRAWIDGAQSTGALACAKHYPGHGRTLTDSHAGIPLVETPRDLLEATDLQPFEAAIAQGVASIMTAHVAFPALDPERRPATFSAPIIGELRTRRRFDGLVVTDAMIMDGALVGRGPGDAGVDALAAGVDVLLYPPDPAAVCAAVGAAVEDGTLPRARVEEALARYEAGLAAAVRATARRDTGALTGALNGAAQFAGELAARVVAAGAPTGGDAGAPTGAPADALAAPLAIEIVDDDLGGPYPPGPSDIFTRRLAERGVALADDGRRIVAVFAEPRAWKGRAGLSDTARARIHAADAALIVLFAHPRLAAELPPDVPVLHAWHRLPLLQTAAADWIAGRIG